MLPNDLREIIGEGDLVRYDTPGFRFEGIVRAIDYECDLVSVEARDFWGDPHEYLCGMERIQLLLKAVALALETKAPISELISA